MRKILYITLLLLSANAFAQNESNFWYFGGGAFDFTSGSPVSIPGFVSTNEGTAAISDAVTGNLLMYTNGVQMMNGAAAPMFNGAGLMGDISTTQAAIIVPQPGSTGMYYVFTADALEDEGVNGYRYSVVDMSLGSGMGGVVTGSKNVLLYDTCSEQLSAVKHANCIDWWIMTKERYNNVYNAYLLTASGLSGPVTSTVGFPVGFSSFGQAKFAPDGSRYAITASSLTQMFDFDNATGMLSNPLTIVAGFGPGYGLTFSGDNSKLYVCRGTAASQIWQYDLSSGVPASILASGTLVGNTGGYNQFQLGKNHKIYISHDGFSNFSVINNPNVAGTGCNFVLGAIPLSSTSQKGVCNFPDSYFNETSPCLIGMVGLAYGTSPTCNGANDGTIWVNVLNNTGPYTVSWSPGGYMTDTVENLPPGTYTVTVNDSAGSTYTDAVTITDPAVLAANVNVSNDTICAGSAVNFNAGPATGGTTPYHYQWSTAAADTNATLTITPAASGYISLELTDDNGCSTSDSVYVLVLPTISIDAPPNNCICFGDDITLTATGTDGYLWNTGDTTASITVSPATGSWYEVSWSNGACFSSDSVFICVNPLPVISLNGQDTLCLGETITITSTVSSGTSPFDYQWSTSAGDILPDLTLSPATTTTVTLEVTDDKGCTDEEDFTVYVFPVADVHTSADTCMCTGESVTVSASGAPFYQWNTGETGSSITLTPVSDTLLIATCNLGPCTSSDSVFICLFPLPIVNAYGDTSVEYKHPVELLATGDGPFSWSPGESLSCSTCGAPVAEPESTTVYTVSVSNVYGCTAQDTVTVEIFYVVRIPNIITPNGDGLNDVFKITGLPPSSALHIFNRWGNEVYFTDNYMNDWQAETDGVYYYALATPDGKTFSGFVQVSGN